MEKNEHGVAIQPYRIVITETYTKEVEIYAEDELHAEEIAEGLCNDGTINIEIDNFASRAMQCHGVSRSSDLELHDVYGNSMGTYTIYQLKDDDELHFHRFAGLDVLKHEGNRVDAKHYNKIYSGSLPLVPNIQTMLENLYMKFNTRIPEDFKGHSLSVSDVVVIEREGKTTAHYVDSVGFQEVPEFLISEPEKENSSLSGKIQEAEKQKNSQKTKHNEKDKGHER